MDSSAYTTNNSDDQDNHSPCICACSSPAGAEQGDALISFTTLLPGQTSPFRVSVVSSPAMKKARVEFRTFLAKSISWFEE